MIIVSLINFFIEDKDLLSNRLRCINASFVLTSFEIYCVYFVLQKAEHKQLGLGDVYDVLLWAGILQALCALAAFLFPPVRDLFLTFASGDMYSNEFFLERRGYGFAVNLVDTYGYAIGLIAGTRMIIGGKSLLYNVACIALLIFCTFVNSRTGLAIIIIGFGFSVFKANTSAKFIVKLFAAVVFCSFVFFSLLPIFFDYALSSQNETLRWVASDFSIIYQGLLGNQLSEPVDFISARIGPPDNAFEFLFGSGHSVYGTRSVLGFATDIGYINLWWMYGIVGISVLFIRILGFFRKGYLYACRPEEKMIIIFLLTTYFMMLEKANMLGYNPGTCVVYLLLFSILHYQNKIRYGKS